MEALRMLWEEPPAAAESLPDGLRALYGGGLELGEGAVYSNFVTSLDGVVALDAPDGSGSTISGRNPGDRFLMGLLRALADAVIVGAGTLRADAGHTWTAEHVFPAGAAAFAELHRPEPRLVVVSAAGDLDFGQRAFEAGALLLTTDAGASRARRRAPGQVTVQALGGGPLGVDLLIAAVRAEGHRRLLTEGGPRLMAGFLEAAALDEMFITLSPVVAGRRSGDGRLAMVEGLHLLPGRAAGAALRSVRAQGSHLFLRYSLNRSGAE